MAAAAETVKQEFDWGYAESQFQSYQFVDDIHELAAARRELRRSGQAILEARRGTNPDFHELLPVDALSTAHFVLQTRNAFGVNSPMYREMFAGLRLDCQRLVAEWYRKNKPEHFPPVRHTFDAEKQEFFSHGLSIRQMTENALVPLAGDQEEEARRLNEHVEDATPQLVRSLGATALRIRTISECTDKAIEDYQDDMKHHRKHRGYRGYVPEIEKVMIRDIRLDTETNDRFEEQVGLPGVYITHEIIQMALTKRGLDASQMGKTELHGSQMLVQDDLMEFVRLLDDIAKDQWCVNIFMGEVVPDDFVKDYTGFRAEALQRQAELKDISDGVADFVLKLAAEDTDKQKAPTIVEEFVKAQLLHLVKNDFEAAEQVFDTRTAKGLQEVAYLEARGMYERANERLEEVQQIAPGGGFCGAGSCGIVAVSELSSKASKARELGLGSGLMYDTVRSCPNCKTKNVYYDSKANKVCTGCDATRINGRQTKGKSKAAFALAA